MKEQENTTGEEDVQQNTEAPSNESELDELRSRVDYLEHKCREIEKALLATHERSRERGDRGFLGVLRSSSRNPLLLLRH